MPGHVLKLGVLSSQLVKLQQVGTREILRVGVGEKALKNLNRLAGPPQPHQKLHHHLRRITTHLVRRVRFQLAAEMPNRPVDVLSEQGAQVDAEIFVQVLKRRFALGLKHFRKLLAVLGKFHDPPQRLGVVKLGSELNDRTHVRGIGVVAAALEEPAAPGDQFWNLLRCRRRSLLLLDDAFHARHDVAMQGLDQQLGAFLAALPRRILAEAGNRAADALVFENQLEPLARMNSLVEGDVDDGFRILGGLEPVDRFKNWPRLADRPEVRP